MIEFHWNGHAWVVCSTCGKSSTAYIPEDLVPVLILPTIPNYQAVLGKTIYIAPNRVIFNLSEPERNELIAMGKAESISWDEAKKYSGYFV